MNQNSEVSSVHDIDGMKIWCVYDELVNVGHLKPHPHNPNKHPDVQVHFLQKILKEQGWRAPIVVSKNSGFMVAGHGRLLAALKNGWTRVPVNYQDFPDEDMEMIHLIADNRIHELSHLDKAELKEILIEIDSGALDMDLTGFSQNEIETMMTAMPPLNTQGEEDEDSIEDPEDTDGSGGVSSNVKICPHCGKAI